MELIFSNTEQYPVYIGAGLQMIRCVSEAAAIEDVVVRPESFLRIKYLLYAISLVVVTTADFG